MLPDAADVARMRRALVLALDAERAGEVPVGAVVVDADGLTVGNDGVSGRPGTLRGLDSLRTRVQDAGGALDIEREDGSFELRLRAVQETV